jgi:hypothetical protein
MSFIFLYGPKKQALCANILKMFKYTRIIFLLYLLYFKMHFYTPLLVLDLVQATSDQQFSTMHLLAAEQTGRATSASNIDESTEPTTSKENSQSQVAHV